MSARKQDRRPMRPGGDGHEDGDKGGRPPGILQVIQSTLAAAFGVQTQEARERDFTRGRPLHYIIAGAVFTVLFILVLVLIVRLVLRSAGV